MALTGAVSKSSKERAMKVIRSNMVRTERLGKFNSSLHYETIPRFLSERAKKRVPVKNNRYEPSTNHEKSATL